MTMQPEPESPATPQERRPNRATGGHASAARWLLRIGSLCLVTGLFGLLVFQIIHRGVGTRLVANVQAGKKPAAPAFRLKVIWPHTSTWPSSLRRLGLHGPISPRDLRGYPVVLNFWASWCVPCGHEAPRFVASAQAHQGRIVFLGVDVKDFNGDARRFLRRHRINYVSVHDPGSGIYDDYGLTGVPETYYLDPRGRIVAHSAGEVSRRELESNIGRIAGSRP